MFRQHPPWNIRIFFWESIKKFFRMNFFCTWSWKLVQVAAVYTTNRTVYDKIWSVVWHLMIPVFLLWNLLDLTGIGSAQLFIFQYTCSYNCNLTDNYHTNYMVSVSTFCHMKQFSKKQLSIFFQNSILLVLVFFPCGPKTGIHGNFIISLVLRSWLVLFLQTYLSLKIANMELQ